MSKSMFSQINSSLQESSASQSFFLLMDEICPETVKSSIDWIMEANFSEERAEVLNLMICSPGGELSSAFALIDVMRGSAIPVRTIGVGEIASCGLMIFMAGADGERILTPNVSILSHQFTSGSFGKSHELLSAVKSFDLTSVKLIKHYKKFSNLDEEQIKKLLLPPQDVWLSPEEAVEYGLADCVKELN